MRRWRGVRTRRGLVFPWVPPQVTVAAVPPQLIRQPGTRARFAVARAAATRGRWYDPPWPASPPAQKFPTVSVQAMFGGAWTDISGFVRTGTVTRPGSRLQGPVWQYQAGTFSLVLNNSDGRFDPDNAAGPYVGATQTRVLTFSANGTWKAPPGVTSLSKVECWGGGGGGGNDPATATKSGDGGGGGEYAAETSVACTPGTVYTLTVGAAGPGGPGAAGANNGTSGGTTTATFDAVTVTAHGGTGGTTNGAGGGTGGTGSGNTVHFSGGTGAAGTATYGGGGGGSAGPAAVGNPGSGVTGGLAVTGGGPGANGGSASPRQNGFTPSSGPGGGGGGAFEVAAPYASGGNGGGGQIVLTYTVTTSATQVIPMVPVRILATYNSVTYPVFSGFADSWGHPGDTFAAPKWDEVTVTGSDAFKVFTNITLAPLGSPVGGGEDSGSRIARILNAASWSSSQRQIATGNTAVQATSFGDTVLNLLQLTADTELGQLYIGPSGNVVFRNRQAILTDARSHTPQSVFGDSPGTAEAAGTELAYEKASRADDDTTLVNDCQITPANGGTLAEVTDGDSIAKYQYPRTYSRTDLLLTSQVDALAYAGWIVYIGKDAENRFDVVTVNPTAEPSTLFPVVLARDLGDRIQMWRRPPGVSPVITHDSFIGAIAHTWTATTWQTDYTLTSAAKYGSFFTLNDPVLGQLNNNALAF